MGSSARKITEREFREIMNKSDIQRERKPVLHPAPEGGIYQSPSEFTEEEIKADQILQFFHYSHLPEKLQSRSKPFCEMARNIIDTTPRNAERSTALRKLLEAKDCAIRAGL
jgi:hypothetical protein